MIMNNSLTFRPALREKWKQFRWPLRSNSTAISIWTPSFQHATPYIIAMAELLFSQSSSTRSNLSRAGKLLTRKLTRTLGKLYSIAATCATTSPFPHEIKSLWARFITGTSSHCPATYEILKQDFSWTWTIFYICFIPRGWNGRRLKKSSVSLL